jgi:hypothetical protein
MEVFLMFVLWPNVLVLIAGGLVVATLGFVVYGCIRGFEKTFPGE